MEKINVDEILKKHTTTNPQENWERNGKFEITNYKSAIKEIAEAVIDKCAEQVTTKTVDAGFSTSEWEEVDKESILKIKQEIDYE